MSYRGMCERTLQVEVQVYLGDIVSLVPDHLNKVNIAIKSHTNFLVSQCI